MLIICRDQTFCFVQPSFSLFHSSPLGKKVKKKQMIEGREGKQQHIHEKERGGEKKKATR